MSQRSITSFFSKVPDKKPTNDSKGSSPSDGNKNEEELGSPTRKENPRSSGDISDLPVHIIPKTTKTNGSPGFVTCGPSMRVKLRNCLKTMGDKPEIPNAELYVKLKQFAKEETEERQSKETNPQKQDIEETVNEKMITKDKTPTLKRNRRRIVSPESSSDEDVGKKKKVKPSKKEEIGDDSSEKDKSKITEKENKSPAKVESKLKKSPKASETKKETATNETKKAATMADFFGTKTNQNQTNKAGNDYNPAKNKYNPIKDAPWDKGDIIPYSILAKTWDCIESVSSRLKIVDILSNYFRSVMVLSPSELLPSIYLCLNRLAPTFEGLELGIAESFLVKSIAQATGRSPAQIKSDLTQYGDLGLVAEKSRQNQQTLFCFRPKRLTVSGIFASLKEVASMTGNASQQKKIDKIKGLLVACETMEARFLVRSLAGKLRIGLAEQSVLQALAVACATTPPNQEYPPKILDASQGISSDRFKQTVDNMSLILKTTYCECPNYDKIVPVLLEHGIEALPKYCRLTPGVPLKPMLAHPTKGVQEVLNRFEGLKFTCEWKYDGERAQIHKLESGEIKIYSRNQEDNTSKYPDIINRIGKCLKEDVVSCILDCESVAWDREQKRILPFQILSTRKRKDANEEDIKVQVCVFMFDLLYLNGEPLVRRPLIERRNLLKSHFTEIEGQWLFATSLDVSSMEEVQEFLEESVKGNCEGLMVKTLEKDATYEIAKRSRNWLKLKKDYLDGVGDTLDVVVIGGYLGKGRRTGTYGGFLLAVYDQQNEEYQSICKIGTGFTDENLAKHTEFLKDHKIPAPKPYYRYDVSHEPDHWFDAVQVWEIKCADLSLSPVHQAAIGIVDAEKGISLRFPRFIRIRDDKNVEDATSAQQVADMYQNQDQIKNQPTTSNKNEEDFY